MYCINNYKEVKDYMKSSVLMIFFINLLEHIGYLSVCFYVCFFSQSLIEASYNIFIFVLTLGIFAFLCFINFLSSKKDNLISLSQGVVNYIYYSLLLKNDFHFTEKEELAKINNEFFFIKKFIYNKQILNLFNIPWLFLYFSIISFFSYTNAILCFNYVSILLICVFYQKFKYKKNKNINVNILKHNDTELFNFINDNEKYLKYSYDVEKIANIMALDIIKKDEETDAINSKVLKMNTFNRCLCVLFYFLISLNFLRSAILDANFTFESLIVTLMFAFKIFNNALPSINSWFDFFDIKKYIKNIFEITNGSSLNKNNISFGNRISIEMKKVSYNDSKVKDKTLEHINLSLEGGHTYVVNNDNKFRATTFLKIICNIFQPTSGKIQYTNIDNGYDFITFLPKEPFFISGTIKEIISGFNDNADENRIANIITELDIVNNINDNYDLCCEYRKYDGNIDINNKDKTKININSILNIKLDKRSRYDDVFIKKLNIARLMYKMPNVIVMDEPFKYLDNASSLALIKLFNTHAMLKKIVIISYNINNKYITKFNNVNTISI